MSAQDTGKQALTNADKFQEVFGIPIDAIIWDLKYSELEEWLKAPYEEPA